RSPPGAPAPAAAAAAEPAPRAPPAVPPPPAVPAAPLAPGVAPAASVAPASGPPVWLAPAPPTTFVAFLLPGIDGATAASTSMVADRMISGEYRRPIWAGLIAIATLRRSRQPS